MAVARANPAQVLQQLRRHTARASDTMGRQNLKKVLVAAETDLARRLLSMGGAGADTFTATQMNMVLRQIRLLIRDVNRGMQTTIVDQADASVDKSAQQVIDYMAKAEKKFKGIAQVLPIREAEVLSRATQGTRASVLRRLSSGPSGREKQGILQRYGANVLKHFEDTLQTALLTRKPWGETRSDIISKSSFLQQAPAHWAERIVRTEIMAANNRASWESTRAAQQQLGDMVKILSATFDGRTGWDSYQVHGMIRRPDQAFEWAGRHYQHPPNRPNDREVVVPHRISWPIPPYLKWRSDGEVSSRYSQQRKSGSPSPRPKMTTVPLEQFGKS